MRRGIWPIALAAHGMALAAIMEAPPRIIVKDDNPEKAREKVSRQRKRWLERQARKEMRRHKTVRR